VTVNDQTEPIRKGLLPCTPPPEWEFHTVFGTRTGTDGCALFPGDAGPVVVRRRVTYGDWEPVHPDRWAAEPETDARTAATPAGPAPATDRVRAVCDQLHRAAVLADGQPHTDRDRGIVHAVTRIRATLDDPARGAQQDPTQDGEADVVRRETVEYFVQCQQPDGSWEQCSSTATDREFATERVAARRRMQPGFTYRIAERTTAVVVRAVAEDTTPPV
jgi:hypothetical protein